MTIRGKRTSSGASGGAGIRTDGGVVFTDPEGTIRYISPGLAARLGYGEEELVASPLRSLLQSDLGLSGSEGSFADVMARSRGGDLIPIRARKAPLDDDAGQKFGALIVTEPLRSAREPHLDATYQDVFEYGPLPMWIYEIETLRFLAVNRAAVEHYGYSKDDFLGMSTEQIRPESEVPRLKQHVQSVSPEVARTGIWIHRKKDGTLLEAETVAYEMEFHGRRARLVLVRDVTEGRRVELALRESERPLPEAGGSLAGSHRDHRQR
ncbi:MAG: PAS domain S-box protein [Thermoanaerobaculia bacterium]